MQRSEREYCVEERGNEFQRRARLLQSIWRQEQGYEVGTHTGRHGERPLGSRLKMPWAQETLANYLTDTVRSVVRREVLDPELSKHKLYGKPRIFNDLLSSQPLSFNLFGELQQDLDLATRVMRRLAPDRVDRVVAIEFEHSPGRGDDRYTGDRSAFDVYVRYTTPGGGDGFIGIEVKYHEDLMGTPGERRPRYDEIAELMGCFNQDRLADIWRSPVDQIWRDHLLAGAHLDADDFGDGFFAFLYPEGNCRCANAVDAYQTHLSSERSFVPWTIEQVADVISQETTDAWVAEFIDRYLDFGKIDAAADLAP